MNTLSHTLPFFNYCIIALLLMTTACGNTGSDETEDTAYTNEAETMTESNEYSDEVEEGQASKPTSTNTSKPKNNPANNWEKLTMLPVKDAYGAITSRIPLPSNWQVNGQAKQGEPVFRGPGGLSIVQYGINSFMYVSDPYMQNMYMQSGQQLRPFPGQEAVIQQDLEPAGQQMGLTLIKSYPIPEVAKLDLWYSEQLWTVEPVQKQAYAMGSEWKKADGSKVFMLTRILVSNGSTMQNWYHYSALLEAENSYYDKAVKQYVFSVANTRYELQPIIAYNQREAQKAGQRAAAFNQRMAANQAAFQATQRAHVNASNSISEMSMQGWRDRNASSDRMQEKAVDGIWEQSNYNSSSAETYKASNNYNQYWINGQGEYISTNDVNYNPNIDNTANNSNWEQLAPE